MVRKALSKEVTFKLKHKGKGKHESGKALGERSFQATCQKEERCPKGRMSSMCTRNRGCKARVRPKGSGVGWRAWHGPNKEFGLRTEQPREGT